MKDFLIPKFKTYNFSPRKGVAPQLNHQLELLMTRAPSDSSASATIERQGDLFLFEIVLRSQSGIFRKTAKVDARERRCRERLWQIDLVTELHHELLDQIHHWRERRFAA
jgi:hypothetical protein